MGTEQQLTTVQQEMTPLLGPPGVLGCLLPSRVIAAYLADTSGARHGPRCPREHEALPAPTHPSAQFPSYLALCLFLPLTDPYVIPADLPSTHLPRGHRPFLWAFLQPASLLPPPTAAGVSCGGHGRHNQAGKPALQDRQLPSHQGKQVFAGRAVSLSRAGCPAGGREVADAGRQEGRWPVFGEPLGSWVSPGTGRG